MSNWSITPYVHEDCATGDTFYSNGALWETSPEGEVEMLPEGWYYRFFAGTTNSESFGPFENEDEALSLTLRLKGRKEGTCIHRNVTKP